MEIKKSLLSSLFFIIAISLIIFGLYKYNLDVEKFSSDILGYQNKENMTISKFEVLYKASKERFEPKFDLDRIMVVVGLVIFISGVISYKNKY